MRKSIWKIIAPVILLVCAALIGMRIYNVNKDVELPPVEVYPEGEYAALGDNYFWQENEMSPGYEVKVESAAFKKYADFVAEYGEDEDYLDEGYRPEYVLDLELTIRNTNTDEETGRGIDFVNMRVQSENESFQIHSMLFALVRPDLGGVLGVKVRPGTEATLHLPYTRSYSFDDFITGEKLMAKDYYLLLSMYPEKVIIGLDPQKIR